METWLKDNSSILFFIRHITVIGRMPAFWRQPRNESFVPAVTKWASLVQSCSLKRYHPSTHLHIRNWTQISLDTTPFGDPAADALAKYACLRSLHGIFINGLPEAGFRSSAFDRIVKLSPNLKDISRTSRRGGSCIIYGNKRAQDRGRQKFMIDAPNRKYIKSLQMDDVDAHMLEELGSYLHLDQLTTLKNIIPYSDFLHLALDDLAHTSSVLSNILISIW
ncbi:hypothetical protein GGU11DRAFT_810827 [Lentinula aff. detonsa]|uniref:Uncharacterized protein n=1 Tax=Lentinula aff. detonsa TaxID=2804958 RepID=A0AA38KR17_9AGAR|nr:hypothetical protein GGU10DRAFT_388715 [Lentinula aff. detonsa]KAJ3794989.1 hypothetical protein GGU11DRAFT_810827 [Lentinula aff. detonsa]